MPKKYLIFILIFAVFMIVPVESTLGIEMEQLKTIAPEGAVFKELAAPFLYYEVYRKDSLIGYCFYTKDIAPEKKGFGGAMNIAVYIDKEGRIVNLEILSHNETPQYASAISEPSFLDQFKEKGPQDKFVVGEDIDAITKATISSTSVAEILKISIDKMQRVIYGDIAGESSISSSESYKVETKKSDVLIKLENSGLKPREAKYYKKLNE